MVKFLDGHPVDVEDIVTGFQRSDGSRFARPSGMLMGPDGQLYFTSDAGDVTGLFRLGPIPKGINIAPIYGLLLNQTY
jgi:glucose/arabinose dehydrogenase